MDETAIIARVPLKNAYSVAAWKNYAFVACQTEGVFGVDIRNPAAPVVRGVLMVDKMDARRLMVDQDRLFVAALDGGLVIYDVRDPSHPNPIGRVLSDAIPIVTNVFARGPLAYVVGADATNARMVVVDVSRPHDPKIIGVHVPLSLANGRYESVGFDGRNAYAGTSTGLLHVLDVQNPARIHRVGEYLYTVPNDIRPTALWGISAMPGRAFLADFGAGVIALDTQHPSAPRGVGTYDGGSAGAAAYRVLLDGNTAYVANGWGGLVVLNVQNPSAMRVIAELAPKKVSYLDIALFGPFALMANNGAPQGLDIIRVR